MEKVIFHLDVKNQFPTAAHLCSWAALVPGHNESAAKRKSTKSQKRK
ncbi:MULTISPECIES: transposase [Neobacillus]|uniref:Transposase n=1 Tax=Neobacillus rhizophilus TaxID=2833579 RepID=A0A942U6Z2_9BACI|nr:MULTISPECIES: transposase [Neobacillus]MBS4214072.1 transposase [Neobacillus rhizophilus]MBU8917525.1 IS110 family transposase [Bacillus sp. FJAT-29953]